MSPIACMTDEADVGMQFYLTDTPGTGGRLKSTPDEFIVDELSDHPPRSDDGRFTIAEVTSRNWETNRLIRLLARQMGISQARIGFAGTKDKRAVTSQLMSFEADPSTLDKVQLKDVSIGDAYRSRRGIQIGDLLGNRFHIHVKDCDLTEDGLSASITRTADMIRKDGGFPNYFGVQRFGVTRPITHRVGEFIIRGDLEAAVDCYLSYPSTYEREDAQEARRALADKGRYQEVVAQMPPSMSFEKILVEHLIRKPDDHAGAIRALPSNLQMMFVHAYQSYLFNLMLSERLRRGIPLNRAVEGDIVIPVGEKDFPLHENPVPVTSRNIDLVARQLRSGRAFVTGSLFGSESVLADGEMGEIEREIIGSEGLRREDFLVPSLPYCNSKGSRRELLCTVRDLGHEIQDDGYMVSFSLSKGNYATCLMREFMKSRMDCY